jgi:glycosyltransferase involved in cell wall biosynthesis
VLSPSDVSAVIVTRGDVDLSPVLDSLIFEDVVVWDNSAEPRDEMTYGRALAVDRARNRVIYSQDDDIIHTPENQRAIVAAYQPGVLTGCMWPEWSDGARAQGIEDGYDDLVFAGSGSVYDNAVPHMAASLYLARFALDDFFRLWADTIIGIVAPNRQLDIRFDALPHAESGDRMCDLPDAVALKTEAIRRGRYVRDRGWIREKTDPHTLYLAEMAVGGVPEHRHL